MANSAITAADSASGGLASASSASASPTSEARISISAIGKAPPAAPCAKPPSMKLMNAAGQTHQKRGKAMPAHRSEEHTSELQSLMRNSYAVFCLKKKKQNN